MRKGLILCVAAALLASCIGCHPGSSSTPASSGKNAAEQKPDNSKNKPPKPDVGP